MLLHDARQGNGPNFINRTSGNLTQVPGSPFKVAGACCAHRVVVHPSGNFVYVTSRIYSYGVVYINAFAVQSDGSLKPVAGSPFTTPGSRFALLAMDPKGEYLYADATTNAKGAVSAFTINGTDGALTPVPGSPFMVPVGSCDPSKDFCQQPPTDLAIDPNAKYLYATLGYESAIAGFAIDRSTGALTDLPGSPYPEQFPIGNFCPLIVNLSNCPYPWMESMDPSGKFIYVADMNFNRFSIFKMNQSTGVPTLVGTHTQGGICAFGTVDVDPSGSFVYSLGVTRSYSCISPGAVLGFSINQGSGGLLSVPGSPFANPNLDNNARAKVLVTR